MNILLYLFFILLSFGQLGRIELFSSVAILSYEIVMILIFALFVSNKWKEIRACSENNRVKAFGIFVGILNISLLVSLPIYSVNENVVALAYLARLILYGLFFVTLLSLQKSILERGLKLFTFATISFSLIQYIFVPNIQFLASQGWDPHMARVVGTFLDATPAGIIFSLLFFYILIRKPLSFRANKSLPAGRQGISVWIFSLISLFLLILLTYSRITYIGFIGGFLYLLLRRYRVKLVSTLIALFFLSIPFMPQVPGESTNLQRTFSINSRLNDMKQGIVVWQQNPLLGIGYNHISSVKGGNTARNHSDSAYSSSFVTILASSGVVGLGAFFYLLWSLYRKGSLLTQSATVTIVVASLVENVFLLNVVLTVYLVLIALEDNR